MESSIAAFLMRWLACELLPTKLQIDQWLLTYALHRAKLAKLFFEMLAPVRETESSRALFQWFHNILPIQHHSVHFITHQSFAFIKGCREWDASL